MAQTTLALNTLHPRKVPTDLLPRTLRDAVVYRVVFEERNPYGSSHWGGLNSHSLTAMTEGIELLVMHQPHPRAIVRPGAKLDKLTKFYRDMGKLRHWLVPRALMDMHDDVAEYVGLAPLIPHSPRNYHVNAYQPVGPWEYLPQEHAWDWRVRARWIIPVAPETVSLTKLALKTSGGMGRARVTIDYD